MPSRSFAVLATAAVLLLVAVRMKNGFDEQSQHLALLKRDNIDGNAFIEAPSINRSLRLQTSTNNASKTMTKARSISFTVESPNHAVEVKPPPPSNHQTNMTTMSLVDNSILPPPILATNISDNVHDFYTQAINDNGMKLANLSSVDYVGCCGLGHRLARMANAAWIANQLNLALHTYWGLCGEDTEIFQHLFGVQNATVLKNVTSVNQHLFWDNEVPLFRKLKRFGPTFNSSYCQCQQDQVQAHYEFYKDLRDRFRYKPQVDAFVNTTFANHTVIGMHIRAGNGEKGDFEHKHRGIPNINEWVKQASQRIQELVDREQWKEPPLLYLATDTPSFIGKFRRELKNTMPVIELPQERRAKGDGIFFGERGKTPIMTDQQCIRQWENAVTDMILLSHADVLIAGRMSSFEQTLPMSLVFGNPSKKVTTPKCELTFDASDMYCSKTYMEWCCNVRGVQVSPEYHGEAIKVPHKMKLSYYKLSERPTFRPNPSTHLPYYWKTRVHEMKTGVMT